MKKPHTQRDEGKFFVDTANDRLSGHDADALAELAIKMEYNQPIPGEFLAAWKDGVRLAGEHLFRVRSDSVESAADKDDLRPDLDVITASLGGISPGERVFILSMYQFFSDSTVRDLCVELGYDFPTLADIANLDISHRTVLTRLIDSYSGW